MTTELDVFKRRLQEAFTEALASTDELLPQSKTGLERLLQLSDPLLPAGWRGLYRVAYVEPTMDQLARRELPMPEVTELRGSLDCPYEKSFPRLFAAPVYSQCVYAFNHSGDHAVKDPATGKLMQTMRGGPSLPKEYVK